MDPLNRARRTLARPPIIGRLDWFRRSLKVGMRLPLDRQRKVATELYGADEGGPPPACTSSARKVATR